MKITPFQHSQILGYALIAYGVFQGFGVVNLLWVTSLERKLSTAGQVLAPQILSGFALCIISLIAGVVIRGKDGDPKVPGLLFVFGALVSFPVGTILSAYVLLFLFVIWTKESDASGEKDVQ
jgi:hypothetical protein